MDDFRLIYREPVPDSHIFELQATLPRNDILSKVWGQYASQLIARQTEYYIADQSKPFQINQYVNQQLTSQVLQKYSAPSLGKIQLTGLVAQFGAFQSRGALEAFSKQLGRSIARTNFQRARLGDVQNTLAETYRSFYGARPFSDQEYRLSNVLTQLINPGGSNRVLRVFNYAMLMASEQNILGATAIHSIQRKIVQPNSSWSFGNYILSLGIGYGTLYGAKRQQYHALARYGQAQQDVQDAAFGLQKLPIYQWQIGKPFQYGIDQLWNITKAGVQRLFGFDYKDQLQKQRTSFMSFNYTLFNPYYWSQIGKQQFDDTTLRTKSQSGIKELFNIFEMVSNTIGYQIAENLDKLSPDDILKIRQYQLMFETQNQQLYNKMSFRTTGAKLSKQRSLRYAQQLYYLEQIQNGNIEVSPNGVLSSVVSQLRNDARFQPEQLVDGLRNITFSDIQSGTVTLGQLKVDRVTSFDKGIAQIIARSTQGQITRLGLGTYKIGPGFFINSAGEAMFKQPLGLAMTDIMQKQVEAFKIPYLGFNPLQIFQWSLIEQASYTRNVLQEIQSNQTIPTHFGMRTVYDIAMMQLAARAVNTAQPEVRESIMQTYTTINSYYDFIMKVLDTDIGRPIRNRINTLAGELEELFKQLSGAKTSVQIEIYSKRIGETLTNISDVIKRGLSDDAVKFQQQMHLDIDSATKAFTEVISAHAAFRAQMPEGQPTPLLFRDIELFARISQNDMLLNQSTLLQQTFRNRYGTTTGILAQTLGGHYRDPQQLENIRDLSLRYAQQFAINVNPLIEQLHVLTRQSQTQRIYYIGTERTVLFIENEQIRRRLGTQFIDISEYARPQINIPRQQLSGQVFETVSKQRGSMIINPLYEELFGKPSFAQQHNMPFQTYYNQGSGFLGEFLEWFTKPVKYDESLEILAKIILEDKEFGLLYSLSQLYDALKNGVKTGEDGRVHAELFVSQPNAQNAAKDLAEQLQQVYKLYSGYNQQMPAEVRDAAKKLLRLAPQQEQTQQQAALGIDNISSFLLNDTVGGLKNYQQLHGTLEHLVYLARQIDEVLTEIEGQIGYRQQLKVLETGGVNQNTRYQEQLVHTFERMTAGVQPIRKILTLDDAIFRNLVINKLDDLSDFDKQYYRLAQRQAIAQSVQQSGYMLNLLYSTPNLTNQFETQVTQVVQQFRIKLNVTRIPVDLNAIDINLTQVKNTLAEAIGKNFWENIARYRFQTAPLLYDKHTIGIDLETVTEVPHKIVNEAGEIVEIKKLESIEKYHFEEIQNKYVQFAQINKQESFREFIHMLFPNYTKDISDAQLISIPGVITHQIISKPGSYLEELGLGQVNPATQYNQLQELGQHFKKLQWLALGAGQFISLDVAANVITGGRVDLSQALWDTLANVATGLLTVSETLGITQQASTVHKRARGLPAWLGFSYGMLIGDQKAQFVLAGLGTMFEFIPTTREFILRSEGIKNVPVQRQQGWEYGREPYWGGTIADYRPSIFYLYRTGAMNNPLMYGSKLEWQMFGTPVPNVFNLFGLTTLFGQEYYREKLMLYRPQPVSGQPVGTFTAPIQTLPLGVSTTTNLAIQFGRFAVGQLLGGHDVTEDYFDRLEQIGAQLKVQYQMTPGTLNKMQLAFKQFDFKTPVDPQELAELQYISNQMTAVVTARGFSSEQGQYLYQHLRAKNEQQFQQWMQQLEYSRYGFRDLEDWLQQYIGFVGFVAGTFFNPMTQSKQFERDITLQQSDYWMTEEHRWFQMQTGNIFGLTEYFRRIVQNERRQELQVNYLPNVYMIQNFPWLSQKYLTGDPYSARNFGEFRLPGPGYEQVYGLQDNYGPVDVYRILQNVQPFSGLTQRQESVIMSNIDKLPFVHRYLVRSQYEERHNILRGTETSEYRENMKLVEQTVTLTEYIGEGRFKTREGYLVELRGFHTNVDQIAKRIFESRNVSITSQYIQQRNVQDDIEKRLKQYEGQQVTLLVPEDPGLRFRYDDGTLYMQAVLPAFEYPKEIARNETDVDFRQNFEPNWFTKIWELFQHQYGYVHEKFIPVRSIREEFERYYYHGGYIQLWERPTSIIKEAVYNTLSLGIGEQQLHGFVQGYQFGKTSPSQLQFAVLGSIGSAIGSAITGGNQPQSETWQYVRQVESKIKLIEHMQGTSQLDRITNTYDFASVIKAVPFQEQTIFTKLLNQQQSDYRRILEKQPAYYKGFLENIYTAKIMHQQGYTYNLNLTYNQLRHKEEMYKEFRNELEPEVYDYYSQIDIDQYRTFLYKSNLQALNLVYLTQQHVVDYMNGLFTQYQNVYDPQYALSRQQLDSVYGQWLQSQNTLTLPDAQEF